ncbi:tRNA preQ1(34) S-adenosylmethionine ribosyltransferase-isomerase QueA [Oscillatoria sp. FACHB-1407]|uniref:tRNA preQ1(34) S-adenosylmethionine ribosyltransferase-isomerase QueA n=1 Tax=Oscillatoria sp. FACHB-1407 TaxID=2692847 RepID=UPI001681FA16|nr:tRNA preQ1(34) S-adenosylmethionine ribosyltransferase-isomerase QueA [Oscillatoria sp. FACHB-1407]MBD2465016.1 tRNA preQ1(34) S-adenosylmethionine ribosyltransferase-isomerase QueA [Oscillatoria sp. FACHB-1407]
MECNYGATSNEEDLQLHAYDYELPPEQIAQNPAVPRDSSRLLVVTSQAGHQHHIFRDLPDLLQPGDLLVLNNTQVIPARLFGRTTTGARVEVLLLEEQAPQQWLALVKPGKRLKLGTTILFGGATAEQDTDGSEPWLIASVTARDEATGGRILTFQVPSGKSLLSVVHQLGEVPLPPYINQSQATAEQYQTVYAEQVGSVAAPTAGLHFTPDLLARLQDRGIQQVFITLHVGVGTFRPVEVEDITAHQMHGEWLDVSAEVVEQICQTKANGGRVIAVGTTATRALEGAAQGGTLRPYCGKTELYIYPGYRWRVIDGLITNFHLPKSSLMMLVSALIGRSRLLALYQEAIAQKYRFYSFGDAMLILPEARVKESGE